MVLTVLIIVFSFILNLFLPWWSIAIPGLILGYLFEPKTVKAFGFGFLALFILWGGQAWYIHIANGGILTSRIAEMMGISTPFLMILITGVIGGLVSGLATLTGAFYSNRNNFTSKKA